MKAEHCCDSFSLYEYRSFRGLHLLGLAGMKEARRPIKGCDYDVTQ
jgi:hypothetical protein